jgi:microcystin-dependent protein
MSEPFVAEIRMVGFNFPPRGWAFCNGQLLPISQNTALFSLLGTTYGGDGKSTFALPNLQNRVPMQPGQGPGLTLRDLGEVGGESSVTLTESEMPAHDHRPLRAHASNANTGTPSSSVSLAVTPGLSYGPAADLEAMGGVVGGGQPHENRQPYLGLNFIIALQGIFPQRP